MRSTAAVSSILAVVLIVMPSWADVIDDAEAKFDEGAKAFSERRYADAANAYERAANLSPHPAPLVNAAEAWERGGNFVRAARDCDAARVLASDEAVRQQIDRRLVRLSRRIGTLEIAGATDFKVRVDDSESVAPPARLRLSAGAHKLVLVDSTTGESRAQDLVLAEGETRHWVLAKATWDAPRHASPAPAEPVSSWPPLGSWIGFGAGAVAGAGAAVFGVLTLNAQSDFDGKPTDASADRFERNRLVTNVLVGAAALGLVVGGAIWLLAPKRARGISSAPLRIVF